MADLMDQQVIDSLIWLGVGQFPDIETIKKAGQIILVDADVNTVKELEKQLVPVIKALDDQRTIRIEQHYLDIESKDSEFYQYNVTEYSALSKIDGLKVLFPGIRLTQTLTVSTTAITDFVRGLALGSQKNNVLCLDIVDQALPMLKALANDGQLTLFSGIQMQSGLTSLYQNAATANEIVDFLASQGYELKKEDSTDPDLPKLSFTINPLWEPLQQAKAQLELIKQQQDRVEAEQTIELSDKDSKLSEQAKQLESAKAEHAKAIAEKNAKLEEQAKALSDKDSKLSEQAKQLESAKAEHAKAIAEKNAKLEEQAKVLSDKDSKLSEQAKQLESAKAEYAKAIAEKNVKLEEQAKALSGKDSKLSEQAKQLESAKAEHVKAIAEKNAKLEEKTKQFETAKADHAKVIAEKNAKLEEKAKQFETAKAEHAKVIAEKNAKLEEKAKQFETAKAEHAKVIAEKNAKLEEKAKQFETAKAEHAKVIAEKNTKFEEQTKVLVEKEAKLVEENKITSEIAKHATARLEKIAHLEKANRQLMETNQQQAKRQYALEVEMLKAEAHIDIIKDLLLKPQ